MVRAAKFAAIVAVLGASIWAPAMAAPEQSCEEAVKDRLLQAAIDRRALGGDATALTFRAVCSWPRTAKGWLYDKDERKEEETKKEEERVKEAFLWTALNFCTTDELSKHLSSSRRGSLLRADALRQERFRSVLGALNRYPEYVKDDAKALYVQRLASLGAPGLVELARTAGCAIDVDRVTMYGILDAVLKLWPKEGWPDEFNPVKMKDKIKNVDLKHAEAIRDSLLAYGTLDSSLRDAAAIAGIDDFAVLDLNWLLTDLFKFAFLGGPNPEQMSAATLEKIGDLERRAGQTDPQEDDLNLNNGGDPPIYSDGDRMLTNVEIRNLVCWAAREKKGTTTGLVAEGQLAWMYAYGKGYPKDVAKARALIADVLSGAERLIDVVGENSRIGRFLTAAKVSWQKISDDLNKMNDSGRARRGHRRFDLAQNFDEICPDRFDLPSLEK